MDGPAGVTDTPGVPDSGARELARYWSHGEGAAKIGWGTPGAYDRCVTLLTEHMSPEHAHGYCAVRHHDATGTWPGRGHGVNKAAHTGGMVALVPDSPSPHAMPGGLAAADLHVTLVYLGDVSGWGEDLKARVLEAVSSLADALSLDGQAARLQGLGIFKPAAGPLPVWASVDVPGLAAYRTALAIRLRATLADAGVDLPDEHDFTPHMTLAYAESEAAAHQGIAAYDALGPCPMGAVVVAFGDDVHGWPLARVAKAAGDSAADLTGLLAKADSGERFTLAPWYVPDRLDSHKEWTDGDTIQKALWGYVRKGDRRIRLQHIPEIVAGEWLEAVTWPFEVTLPMTKADGTVEDVTYPPNTTFLGVHWNEWAWPLVLKGKITGLSVGGRAMRRKGLAPGDTSEPVVKHGTPGDPGYFLLHPNSSTTTGAHASGLRRPRMHPNPPKGAPAHSFAVGSVDSVEVGDTLFYEMRRGHHAHGVITKVDYATGDVWMSGHKKFNLNDQVGKGTTFGILPGAAKQQHAVDHWKAALRTGSAKGSSGAPTHASPVDDHLFLDPGDTLYVGPQGNVYTVLGPGAKPGQVLVLSASGKRVTATLTSGKGYSVAPGPNKGQHLLGQPINGAALPSSAPRPVTPAPAPAAAATGPNGMPAVGTQVSWTSGSRVYTGTVTGHRGVGSSTGQQYVTVTTPSGLATVAVTNLHAPPPAATAPSVAPGIYHHQNATGAVLTVAHDGTGRLTITGGGGTGHTLNAATTAQYVTSGTYVFQRAGTTPPSYGPPAPSAPTDAPYVYTPTVGTVSGHSNPAFAGNTYTVSAVNGASVTITTQAGTTFTAQAGDLVGLPVGAQVDYNGSVLTVTGYAGGLVQFQSQGGGLVKIAANDPALKPHSAVTGQGAALQSSAPSYGSSRTPQPATKPTLPTIKPSSKKHPGFDAIVKQAGAISSHNLRWPTYSHAQPLLAKLTEFVGNDDLPTVMQDGKEMVEMDLVHGTHQVMYRSFGTAHAGGKRYTAKENVDDFQKGQFYAGSGIYGHGTYAAQDLDDSADYAGGRRAVNQPGHAHAAMMRLALPKTANVADYNTVNGLHQSWMAWARYEYSQTNDADLANAMRLFHDVSLFAAALGYDAIHVPGGNNGRRGVTDYWSILNRGVLVVQDGPITVNGSGKHGL